MQTSYSTNFNDRIAGQVSDARPHSISHLVNDQGANVPFGIGVIRKAAGTFDLPAAVTEKPYGVLTHSHYANNQGLSGDDDAIVDGNMGNIMTKGAVCVEVEESVSAGDRAYMRVTAGASEQAGAFRKSSDSGDAIPFPGYFDTAADASGIAVLVFDCEQLHERPYQHATFCFDHGEITADTTIKKFKPSADYNYVIEQVEYYNPTGLAKDATNFANIRVLNGTDVAANHSTETGEEEDIAAETPTDLVLDSDYLVIAAGSTVEIDVVEGGAVTLPAGSIIIHGHFIN